MSARDGTRLDADVYRPDASGSYPVLLMRQPYGRRIASTVCYAHPAWYAAQGYIVAIQDVRGRGTSAGAFRLFEDDARDGADAVAWAAALPGGNGAVGMYGFSYQGTNQLLTAALASPALRAAAPAMIGWDLRTDWAHEGGAFCLANNLGWAIQLAAETARLRGDADAYDELRRAGLPVHGAIAARPDLMERYRALSHYHDWIERPERDPYWDRLSPAAHAEAIAASGIAMLFVGGWFDTHFSGTLTACRALAPHLPTRLVVGPWAHLPWGPRLGAVDFGATAASDIDHLQVRWFDRWLKGIDDDDAPVRLFDTGAQSWRDFPAFPRSGGTWFLHGTGRASIDSRDGALRPDPPDAAGEEAFVHDPWRPVPSVAPGQDRAGIDQRGDTLTFTTAPVQQPTELAGTVVAALHVTADAPDFDVSCVLSRVTPGGAVFALAEGYRRVRDRVETVHVPMRAVFHTLQPGEALRLSIAAAAFPAFPVNPGTGADPTRTRTMDAEIITLHVRHGSSLTIGD